MTGQSIDPSLLRFPGGWEAHKDRHCIWIVSPAGYVHSEAFSELGEALSEAFSDIGGSAPLVRHHEAWNGRVPIILGANLLPPLADGALPAGSIIYNLEQVDRASDWFLRRVSVASEPPPRARL